MKQEQDKAIPAGRATAASQSNQQAVSITDGIPIALVCDVCRCDSALGCASSALGPITWAYCSACLQNKAEPESMFAYTYECCGNDVADWVRELTTYHGGQYVSWDAYAQGMETQRAKTAGLGPKDDSPVRQDAPTPTPQTTPENPHD